MLEPPLSEAKTQLVLSVICISHAPPVDSDYWLTEDAITCTVHWACTICIYVVVAMYNVLSRVTSFVCYLFCVWFFVSCRLF